jgi:tRNA threonylcarbamoyladenosine biosynthesis protein TsaB
VTRVAAFDTSTWIGSVALLEDGGAAAAVTVREVEAPAESSHAAQILTLLERTLAEAGWSKSIVDAYVATRGPGSFTGLRVGLGTIRGLSLAAERPAVGIGTLDAMAEASAPSSAPRLALLDAGRGEVFGGRFDAASSPPRALDTPWVGPVEQALEGGPRDVTVIANAGFVALERLRAAGYSGPVLSPQGTLAAAAGRIALALLRAGLAPGTDLAPLYLRPPDAERKPPASKAR